MVSISSSKKMPDNVKIGNAHPADRAEEVVNHINHIKGPSWNQQLQIFHEDGKADCCGNKNSQLDCFDLKIPVTSPHHIQ